MNNINIRYSVLGVIVLAFSSAILIPGQVHAITHISVSFPILDEIRNSIDDVKVPIGTIISVAINDPFNPEYRWKYNGSGFYASSYSHFDASSEADDEAAHIDCCGDHNDSVLLAVRDDIAVGERVDVCVETPSMLDPSCYDTSVDKYNVIRASFSNDKQIVDAFENYIRQGIVLGSSN